MCVFASLNRPCSIVFHRPVRACVRGRGHFNVGAWRFLGVRGLARTPVHADKLLCRHFLRSSCSFLLAQMLARLSSFAVALVGLVLISGASAMLTVQVEPKASECFGFEAQSGQKVSIPFFVQRGGLLDIDMRVRECITEMRDASANAFYVCCLACSYFSVKIFGPNKEQIYSGLQFEGSVYEFVATSSGHYQLCWNNEMARWTAKVVQFEVNVGDQGKQTKRQETVGGTLVLLYVSASSPNLSAALSLPCVFQWHFVVQLRENWWTSPFSAFPRCSSRLSKSRSGTVCVSRPTATVRAATRSPLSLPPNMVSPVFSC